MTQGLWANAEQTPERVAVVDPDGSSITFGSLAALANQLSHALLAMGCGRDAVVAVATHNHHLHHALSFATGQIGAHLVPINWHLTRAEIAYILEDSVAQAVFVGDGLHDVLRQAADDAGLPTDARFSASGDHDGYRSVAALVEGQPTSRPTPLVSGHWMTYTSGTTGRPKGVRRPIMDIPPETLLQAMGFILGRRDLDAPTTWLIPGPVYHSAPNAHSCEGIYNGGTVVLMDRWDAEAGLALIERHRVTHMFVAPIVLTRWLALPPAVRSQYDVTSLRLVMHAGAPCPTPTKRAAIDWLGPILYEYYGGTEGMFTSITSEEWLAHPGSVGNADAAMAEIKVLDEVTDEELPAGEVGVLYTKFPGLEFRYHNAPEKTADATRGDFITPGDMGYIDQDGWLHIVDRRTDMILSGGVNVYPAEIESILAEHPAVADVAVVGAPDDEWGNRIVAFIEPAPGQSPTAEELIAHCVEHLAGFKCPRQVELRAELPRNAAGKLLRRVLRDELAGRVTA